MSMNNIDKMIGEIMSAQVELESAKARSSGVAPAKERMKNLLFTYWPELVKLARDNKELKEENTSLATALEEADRENDLLCAEVKSLKLEKEKTALGKKSGVRK